MPMLATVLWWVVLGVLLGWMGSWMFNRTLRTRTLVEPESPVAAAAPVVSVAAAAPLASVARVTTAPVADVAPGHPAADAAAADAAASHVASIRALKDRVAHLEALAGVLADRVAAQPPAGLGGDAATVADPRALTASAPPASPRAGDARSAPPALDRAAAAAAGFAPRHDDDLEVIEGIGPRIAALMRAEGIATWHALAGCPTERLRGVLDLGGPGFRIADPGTWPEQAALAAAGRWAELRALQDRLVAGRR